MMKVVYVACPFYEMIFLFTIHKTVHSHSIGDGDKVHISSTVVIYEELLQQPKVNCDIS